MGSKHGHAIRKKPELLNETVGRSWSDVLNRNSSAIENLASIQGNVQEWQLQTQNFQARPGTIDKGHVTKILIFRFLRVQFASLIPILLHQLFS